MVKNLNNLNRAIDLIINYKKKLSVDLTGLKVFTELGSNNYLLSPIIPLICGAEFVHAFVKDTAYGNANELKNLCFEIANELGLGHKLNIYTGEYDYKTFSEVDIVTNSGMLRPFNAEKLKYFGESTVLPLMFEAWEIRESDLDINFCKQNNIKVAGTWENHPEIKVFDFVKMLGLKMAMEAGFEVMGNSIYIWSDDHFGEFIKDAFLINGATQCKLGTSSNELISMADDLDFIFVCDYDQKLPIHEVLPIIELKRIKSNFKIIHLYGNVNIETFRKLNIEVFPSKNGNPEIMTYTLAHVGLVPIIALQVAGYKVAIELLNNNLTELSQKLT